MHRMSGRLESGRMILQRRYPIRGEPAAADHRIQLPRLMAESRRWRQLLRRAAMGACLLLALAGRTDAQTAQKPAAVAVAGASSLGAPVPPAVLSRDEAGNTFVRATRITEPLRIDGRLDEPAYSQVQFIGDFVQQEPRTCAGSPCRWCACSRAPHRSRESRLRRQDQPYDAVLSAFT